MVANGPRPYSAAHFGLELDDVKKPVGMIRSVEGGHVSAEVINYQYGETYDVWRQLGKPKYEDIKIQCGMGMAWEWFAWIKLFFDGKGTRRNGAIVAADFRYQEQARREFFDAMITELALPKLDGSDKSPAYVTMTLSPERIKFVKGSQAVIQEKADLRGQQMWTACNFHFTIDGGLDAAVANCTKIDGFSIKQKMIEYQYGESPQNLKVPGRMEWPNITFYIPEVDAKPIIDKYLGYATHETPADAGLTGAISYQDNTKKDLFTINLAGLHVKSVTPDKGDAGSEEIKMVKVEMAVESMTFDWPENPM